MEAKNKVNILAGIDNSQLDKELMMAAIKYVVYNDKGDFEPIKQQLIKNMAEAISKNFDNMVTQLVNNVERHRQQSVMNFTNQYCPNNTNVN